MSGSASSSASSGTDPRRAKTGSSCATCRRLVPRIFLDDAVAGCAIVCNHGGAFVTHVKNDLGNVVRQSGFFKEAYHDGKGNETDVATMKNVS